MKERERRGERGEREEERGEREIGERESEDLPEVPSVGTGRSSCALVESTKLEIKRPDRELRSTKLELLDPLALRRHFHKPHWGVSSRGRDVNPNCRVDFLSKTGQMW